MRCRGIDRLRCYYRLIFANGAIEIVLIEPEVAQAAVQVLVDGIDVVQPVERRGGVRGTAGLHQQICQLLQRFRAAAADPCIVLQFLDGGALSFSARYASERNS